MNLNKYFSRPVIESVELFSAGWCNLSCDYCYIPKTDFLKGIHSNILKSIKYDQYLDDLKEMVGKDLTVISHWGTEPTLTVFAFKRFYSKVLKAFPKLRKIKLSSNFMTPPENLFEFIIEILPQKKKLDVDIQVSLDGPAYITDKNRIGGSTKSIIKNCLKFTRLLNKHDTVHNVSMHLKPTFGAEDIKTNSEFEKMSEYYTFFDEFVAKWVEINENRTATIYRGVDPTIVLPGAYTTEDGKNFAKMIQNQVELQNKDWKGILTPESNYFYRWKNKLPYYREFFTKQKMFTCSAGDSCFALGDKPKTFHICHQSFYVDHPDFIKEATEYGLDPQTMGGIESGRMDDLNKHYIKSTDDEMGIIKVLYKNRAYNDFFRHRMASNVAVILEMAFCGQVSECFKDEKMAEMLSYFSTVTDCPMDNIIISGSQTVPNSSLFRLLGNGAFENIFKRILEEK